MNKKAVSGIVLTLLLIGVCFCLLLLLASSIVGNFTPEVEGAAPATVRYAIITPDDSGTAFIHDLEVLFYTLQPLDLFNEIEVAYSDLFTAPNTPRYNLIIWDRWQTINYGSVHTWLSWHYNNGSNVLGFYDALSYGDIGGNFVFGGCRGANWAHQTWFNITSNPFVPTQDIQLDNVDDVATGVGYHSPSHLKSGVNTFAYVNDTAKIAGYYVEEGSGHGRCVWWGFRGDDNMVWSPMDFGNAGINRGESIGLTWEFPEIVMKSIYWCANAPVVHALPTFSNRYDDHWGAAGDAEGKQDGSDYLAWLTCMKNKGIPLSHAHCTRHTNNTNSWQDTKDNTEWKDQRVTGSTNSTPFAEYTVDAYMDGWLEWTSHGWTHFGNSSDPDELDEKYDYGTYQHTSHGIFDHVNESIYEAETIFSRYEGSINHEDINVLTMMGSSLYGNKSVYACYEVGIEYLYAHMWSGWLFPNGTATSTGDLGKYTIDEETLGVWQGQTGINTDSPSSSQITNENKLQWNGYAWLSIPSNQYVHAGSWTNDEWSAGVPNEYIDMIEDTIENFNWARVLWMEDQGDYDKGFKTNDWSSFTVTWDGTTISITDNLNVDYIVKAPHGKYVSAVTIDNAGWYVFSKTEAYIPASATSVSITTSASPITTPHVQTVRRANRNITTASYSASKLTLALSGIKALFTEIEVYCGDKGKPIAIYTANGTLTWSYNTSTTILTLNVTHASPTRILLYWKFPGDIDADGDVDASDLFDLSKAYGSKPRDPNWNPNCDLNGDDKVDASDLFDLSKDYGKTNP